MFRISSWKSWLELTTVMVVESIPIIDFSDHQGANPWQSGKNPSGSGAGMGGEKRKAGLLPSPRANNSAVMQGGGRQGSYDIAGAISHLQQIDSPQSKAALNLLDSVLAASSKVPTIFCYSSQVWSVQWVFYIGYICLLCNHWIICSYTCCCCICFPIVVVIDFQRSQREESMSSWSDYPPNKMRRTERVRYSSTNMFFPSSTLCPLMKLNVW